MMIAISAQYATITIYHGCRISRYGTPEVSGPEPSHNHSVMPHEIYYMFHHNEFLWQLIYNFYRIFMTCIYLHVLIYHHDHIYVYLLIYILIVLQILLVGPLWKQTFGFKGPSQQSLCILTCFI